MSQASNETRPKIVVLDGHTTSPGDLSWAPLAALGELEVFERTPEPRIVERARGAAIVLTNKAPLRADTLKQLPTLKLVSVLATGVNVIDLEAARLQGIVVSNVPGYSTASTAQATIALLLELTHHIGDHSRGVHEGRWQQSPDFAYWDRPLIELDGLTLGIVGLGAIGQRVARIALALGMKVQAHTRTPKPSREVALVDLPTLLSTSDVISLHCPLTADTQHLIRRDTLAQMKHGALLLNASRGAVIHEADVARALESGQLGGAAVDVLSSEPPGPDNPLLAAPNCIITPHFAWATSAARQRLLDESVENVRAFLAGQPRNVCG